MRQKYNYEYVKEYFEARGYQLESSTYNKVTEKLDTVCPNGHPYPVTFSDFKDKKDGSRGSRCRVCFNNSRQKHNYEYVKEYFQARDYQLNSSTYNKVTEKLDTVCPNGHPYPVSFIDFKDKEDGSRGTRCPICVSKNLGIMRRKYNYEYVKEYFQTRGYKLKSSTFNNVNEKLDTICPNGHPYPVSFSVFKDKEDGSGGSRCPICVNKNIKYSQKFVEDFVQSFGYELVPGTSYLSSKSPLHLLCPEGHLYPTTFDLFKNKGSRCQKCVRKNLKYTIKEVRDYISKQGYILMSDHYVDSHIKLHLKCPIGHDYYVPFDGFKNGNRRCDTCYNENRLCKEDHPNWKGGIGSLASYLRGYIDDWKKDSLNYYGRKCVITGREDDLEVHHLYSFKLIAYEVMESLNLPIYQTTGEYTSDQLISMVRELRRLHACYPLGVPLNKKVHTFFHNTYPGECTPEDFYKFTDRYYDVDFNTLDFPKAKIPKRKRNALTDQQAVEAYMRRKNGDPCRQIAKDYGVSGSTIENIVNGKTYKHLNLEPIDEQILPWDEVMEIREALMKDVSGVDLAKEYNVSTSVVSAIRRGSSGGSKSRFKKLPPLPIGKRAGKLTSEDISEIRERRKSEKAVDIGKDYGISRQLVNDIVTGRRYKHIC